MLGSLSLAFFTDLLFSLLKSFMKLFDHCPSHCPTVQFTQATYVALFLNHSANTALILAMGCPCFFTPTCNLAVKDQQYTPQC